MNNNYKNIKKLINAEQTGPIFFVTPNPNRGIGLEKEIKGYHIICSQNSDLVDYLKKEKISVLCLNNDKIKNSGKILENKKVLSYIKRKAKNKTANIITFKPSPKIHKICADNNFRYIGNDWRLNRELENKIEFVKITNKLKIPNAKSKIIKVENSEKFQSLFDLKEKYVIQLPRGFSGNSTFLIKSKTDLNEIIKKYKGRKVKVSEYLNGGTYTINACVGKFGIAVSRPIFQITGLTDYNKNKLGTSGNDYEFGKNLKSGEKKKIFNYTKKIGEYMEKLGYKGIFGLDFVVGDSKVDLIEINPRLIASIPVFTKLQMQSVRTPFLFLHLTEFLGIYCEPKLLSSQFSFAKWSKKNNFNFSQLILRNVKKNPIRIIKSLKSGVYEIEKGKLILKKKMYFTDENLKESEFLIQCSAEGSVINSDMEYANIQAGYGIMKNKKQFKQCFNFMIKTISKEIKVKIVTLPNCHV